MKKWYTLLPACLLWTALAVPDFAAAADKQIRVYIDGKPVQFAVQPILENGTTLVQFRPIFEKLGLSVQWDEATQTVTGTKDDLQIELTIDSDDAYINNRPNKLELAPRLVDGNTLVPLRLVGEASGKEVTWDGNTSSIYLKSPAASQQPANSGGTAGGGTQTGGSAGGTQSGGSTTGGTKPDRGDYAYPNGNKYTGQMQNGVPEGKGKIVNASGKPVFDGTLASGNPSDGRYKSYYADGKLEFDGILKNGVNNGAGKQYSSGGKLIFDGTFVDDERSSGTLYYDNGDKYTGAFDGDKPSGTGKIAYKNGDVFQGDFVNGNREGKGTYTTSKGEKVVGDFKNNLMNGIIYHYDKKGKLLSVSEYVNDVLVRKVDMGDGTSTLPNTNTTPQSNALGVENDRHNKALAAIKDRYDQNKKQLDDQIAQIRKDNPGVYASQADYNKALQEATTQQTNLTSRINSLAGDTSQAATAAKAELNKQLTDVQTLVGQINAKGTAQQRIEVLKNQLTTLRTSYTTELEQENNQHSTIVAQLKSLK